MNRLAWLLARRYMRSPKSLSVINTISKVSVAAIGVPVAAMIILLSVFNGFDSLVQSMYNCFDADLLISPTTGKTFELRGDTLRKSIATTQGVMAASAVLEDNVMLEYRGRQSVATVKGVDSLYDEVVPIASIIVSGTDELTHGEQQQAVVGQGVAYNLGVRTAFYDPLRIYYPSRSSFSSLLPMDAYRSESVFPTGVFALDAETDGKYILVDIGVMQNLGDYANRATAIVAKTSSEESIAKVQERVRKLLGSDFTVLTRYEQKASMLRIMRYEKWGIFFIILMVMVIASFSIVGTLVMLIIDKRDDTQTLLTMGAEARTVRRIFFNEGLMISFYGIVGGLLTGLAVCAVQIIFEPIKIGAATFLVDAYPVEVQFWDVVAVSIAAITVSIVLAWSTVRKMMPTQKILYRV